MKQFLLILSLLSTLTARAYDYSLIDGIEYKLDTSTKQAEVTSSSTKYTGNVTIPATVMYEDETYSVTAIGPLAFSGCTGLTSVTIGNRVTIIKNYAFSGCTSLKTVTIGNSVTTIENYAFNGCTGLKTVTIGNSVTEIGENAFQNCSSLTSIEIPNSVTTIGNYAFYGCSRLTSVTIGNSVTTIGNGAFSGCSALTSVTIPNSVTTIGEQAFYGCSHLASVDIPDGVTSIGSGAFYNCYYMTSVTIGNGVTSIEGQTFYGCSDLASVTIGNSVTTIGGYAFYQCYDLTSVTIPGSVTTIETYAFGSCSGLTAVHITDLEAWCKISFSDSYSNPLLYAKHLYMDGKEITDLVIPSSVTSIGKNTFYGCEGLTSVTIHNSVTEIGKNAFYSCSGLKDVYCYAENVPKADSDAFYYKISSATLHVPAGSLNNYKTTSPWSKFGTIKGFVFKIDGIYYGLNNNTKQAVVTSDETKYTGSVTIPATVTYNGVTYNVTSIEDGAFQNCSDLTSVTIPTSVTSIGKNAFNNCLALTSVTIPSNVKSIGDYAFLGCPNLKKVELRSNAIASETYTSNSNLKSLFGEQVTEYVLGDNVASIGDYAFFDCSLTSVTLGRGVTSIGNYAFANYPELKDFYCYAEYAPTISRNAFQNSYIDCVTLHVPAASLEDYKAAATWKNFGDIVAIGDVPGVKKCAAPTITVADGKIILCCETEGAEFEYVITTPHVKSSDGNVSLSDKLLITVFATSDGYQPSDEVTQEIDKSLIQGKKGDVNLDGRVNGTDIQEVINIIVNPE